MIRALIFDFDGLIVDTESPAFTSWQQIYAEYGHDLTMDLWQGALGTNHGFDALAHLIGLIEAKQPLATTGDSIFARRQQIKSDLSLNQPLLPGVLALLDQADAADLPCAIASSSGREWVEGWLRRHGIFERFAVLCTGDEVELTKPNPALFLLAAERLGISPAEGLVFEDSPNGILAARAAGCPAVLVPGAITGQLKLPPADLVLTSLDQIPLAEMISRVSRVPQKPVQ